MDAEKMQDASGLRIWLVLTKAFHALAAHAEESLNLSQSGLGNSDFRVLGVLLHKGSLPVNTIGPKVWLTPGSISVAIDSAEEGGARHHHRLYPTTHPRRPQHHRTPPLVGLMPSRGKSDAVSWTYV